MLTRQTDSREPADVIRDKGHDLAAEIERVTDQIGAACDRLGPRWQRIEDAVVELGQDLEGPASRVARAASDLSYELKRSLDRITRGRRPRSLAFWR